MNIYTSPPKDWRQLQSYTAKFLQEIGYESKIEEKVKTVRGNVEVDVLAKNSNKTPHSLIICECKYWEAPIPQNVIHSFRTVLADIGANYGFIISKNGFQSGAYEAASNSNLNLFTWNDFQNYFRENWVKARTFEISKINKDLKTYISAGFPVYFKEEYKNLSPEDFKEFERLYTMYFHTGFYSMNHDYIDLETKEFDIKYFEQHIKESKKIYSNDFASYEDFFNFLIKDANEGVIKFDKLFKKSLRSVNGIF